MYRCNETGREFEEPRYDPDFWNKGDGAKVCPCCGDTDYDEVFECDICCAHVTWDDGHVGSKYGNSFLCPACRKVAIVNLFEKGAQELGDTEGAWLDDVLDGNSWADLKKIYEEAKKNGTVTL